jgi:hypothetical protein
VNMLRAVQMALDDARCADVSYEDAADALQELRERIDAPRAAALPGVPAAARAAAAAGLAALRDARRAAAGAASEGDVLPLEDVCQACIVYVPGLHRLRCSIRVHATLLDFLGVFLSTPTQVLSDEPQGRSACAY